MAAGDWIPFRFGRGSGPKLSHVCFADDLLLVAEASLEQVHNIKHILQEFCSASGQKISLAKSHVFFSNNVPEDTTSRLSQELGIQITSDLGVYLGAPMIHQRASAQSYKFVLDRMRKKLSGWKATSLSFAGRITLAQSSLANIHGYVLQSAPIPVRFVMRRESCAKILSGVLRLVTGGATLLHGIRSASLRRRVVTALEISNSLIRPT